jgi:2-polyprenyl-3-methyl-5-hydroxy-6-metoxy-1,4-benzoquinol methylase
VAQETDALLSTEEYTVCLCQRCDLHFAYPMQAPGSRWYEDAAVYSALKARAYRTLTVAEIRKRWRYEAFFDLDLIPGGRLLEVGCGAGEFLFAAKHAGYEVTGLDFNQHAISTAKESYGLETVYSLSIEDYLSRGPTTTHDIVCLFEVIEHLEDPVSTVRSIKQLLAPGGYLVLTMPSHRRWPHLYYQHDFPPHHLTLWSETSVRTLLAACGLSPMVIKPSRLRARNLLHTLSVTSHLAQQGTLLFRGLQFIELLADHLLAGLFRLTVRRAGGFFLFAIAQKPYGEGVANE